MTVLPDFGFSVRGVRAVCSVWPRLQNGPEIKRLQARFDSQVAPLPSHATILYAGGGSAIVDFVSSIRGDALRRDETPQPEKQLPGGAVLVNRHGA
jgi:hypothetical protein